MTTAEHIVRGAEVYGAIGLMIAMAFLLWGIDRIDPSAHRAYVFRPLLIPGIVLLWPLVVWRWLHLERGGDA